jgi:hypothetical protein
MIARPRRDAGVGQPALGRDGGDRRLRAVTPGHRQGVSAWFALVKPSIVLDAALGTDTAALPPPPPARARGPADSSDPSAIGSAGRGGLVRRQALGNDSAATPVAKRERQT